MNHGRDCHGRGRGPKVARGVPNFVPTLLNKTSLRLTIRLPLPRAIASLKCVEFVSHNIASQAVTHCSSSRPSELMIRWSQVRILAGPPLSLKHLARFRILVLIIALRGVLWGLLRASAPILRPSVLREAFSSFRRHLMRQALSCELGQLSNSNDGPRAAGVTVRIPGATNIEAASVIFNKPSQAVKLAARHRRAAAFSM